MLTPGVAARYVTFAAIQADTRVLSAIAHEAASRARHAVLLVDDAPADTFQSVSEAFRLACQITGVQPHTFFATTGLPEVLVAPVVISKEDLPTEPGVFAVSSQTPGQSFIFRSFAA